MLEEVEEKDAGWTDWLKKMGIWDDRMTEGDAYRRYVRFKEVDWGSAPAEMVPQCLRDLLPLERGLVYGDAIGEVDEFEFRFEVEDSTPIRHKPIAYKKEEREWIRQYIEKLIELDILEQIQPGMEEPLFAVGIVLVKEGQQGQAYRFCANLVEPNSRIRPAAGPLNDIQSTLDELQGTAIKSAIDIKAGFFNLRLAKDLQKYAGLVTQDGLYRLKRMIFGFGPAPAAFQGVMNEALRRARRRLK